MNLENIFPVSSSSLFNLTFNKNLERDSNNNNFYCLKGEIPKNSIYYYKLFFNNDLFKQLNYDKLKIDLRSSTRRIDLFLNFRSLIYFI